MKLSYAFMRFIDEKEAFCSEATIYYYRLNVQRFVDFIGSDTEVKTIDKEQIVKYVAYLRTLGLKHTSINTYIRAVKVFWQWLLDADIVNDHLFLKVKNLRDDSENIIPLYQDEADQLDSCFDSCTEYGLRNLCIIHLMLDAGLRSGEVIRLKLSDLHFEKRLIYVYGKGAKYRVVPMCEKLHDYLNSYCVQYRSASAKEMLIVRPDNHEGLTKYGIDQLFVRARGYSGIDRLHPHLLRHTFATSYIMGGGNMEFLRIMLGHSDYAVTKRYLHLASQFTMMKAKVYRLDKVFFETAY